MTTAVRLARTGCADVLEFIGQELSAPGPGEVLLEHDAIGVNYLDVTQRNGAVPIPLPSSLGLEGAGIVAAVGDGVEDVSVGDRVGYALGPLGAYADARLYPANRLLKLPEDLSSHDAASLLLKGLTAQYLLTSTFPVGPGVTVLLYGAAGGLGAVMAPWAARLGAKVIGVVSRESSIERAKVGGCSDVVIWSNDLPDEIARITQKRGVDVVYDGVGKTTFAASLECLRSRGTMVSIGASSGVPDPVSVTTLNKKSLFLTRPSLAAHITDVAEYRERARDLFAAIAAGIVRPDIWKTYPLSQVAEAHRALEGGQSRGAITLDPR
ncbi:Alcohol dehydrogenase zinc-binding domain protein (plasmid) [Rhizobium leguminosarum bv. trifolii WSM2304]|uniref:Alcohol dehydrogenase zinc-binding domain protein n=1 Tax=Rhizobium leguminosarum bv. trifolii (strain WSM2304) TaxID=395492 RepID=A0ABF7QZ77_RHILW|nr:quinone oxidoreductase [Rhizobium leguminosarum]ACI59546.1 Alcohol dehydrogenase zinc-binding domain protein [Rhizobium leguminosarum bv. trifolii WSM2304]